MVGRSWHASAWSIIAIAAGALLGSHLFIAITLGDKSKKNTAVIQVKECSLPTLSSKSFIVSGLTFRSLIYFGFIFMYGVTECSNFIITHVAVQFSQHHILRRLSFLHCVVLSPLS